MHVGSGTDVGSSAVLRKNLFSLLEDYYSAWFMGRMKTSDERSEHARTPINFYPLNVSSSSFLGRRTTGG